MGTATPSVVVFLFLCTTVATAQQATAGSCLGNGQTCQWDTSLGNCCSTYCYQQVGQTTGVCQDRPAATGTGATAQTATAGAATAYQTPQRNPASYTPNGLGIYSGAGQGTSSGTGQCLQNGQTCQWDTSMGNCCSTYCYQQTGQTTGVCQDRSGSSTGSAGSSQPYQTLQYSAPAYSQPGSTYSGSYSGASQSQSAYSGQAYTSGIGQGGQGSCLANGQSCTWSGSMGNCCSGWCQQLEPQPTGTCAQPAGTPGPAGTAGGYPSQTLQRNPSNPAPSSMTYSTPGQAGASQYAGGQGQGGGSCIANGQTCQWDTSMGDCCSTYCYQQQGQTTGVCQTRSGGGSSQAGAGTYQGAPQYSAPVYSQPAAYAPSPQMAYSPSQAAYTGGYSGSPQASQPAYSGQGYSSGQGGAGGCLSTGQSCTWSGSTGNCCSGWCKQMETEATGTCSEKIYSQGR